MPELTKAQLKERMNYIGASDAAAVLGMSRWKTPLMVWAEKTGQIIPEDISGKLPVKLGHKLEQTVADLFMEETGKSVREIPNNMTLHHPNFPFLAANLDRLIVGEHSALECKTVSAWKAKEFENEEFPQEFIIQCFHQMMVTAMDSIWLAVLIGNQDFKVKQILWDDKTIDTMLRKEVHFWESFIIPKVMPMQISCKDTDTLFQLFPEENPGSIIALGDKGDQLIERINAMKADQKSLDGSIEQLENELKVMLKDKEAGTTNNFKISWKTQSKSWVDSRILKKEMPDIHAKYLKETKFRALRINALKGESE
jgi:putative phage-type endonuclease